LYGIFIFIISGFQALTEEMKELSVSFSASLKMYNESIHKEKELAGKRKLVFSSLFYL